MVHCSRMNCLPPPLPPPPPSFTPPIPPPFWGPPGWPRSMYTAKVPHSPEFCQKAWLIRMEDAGPTPCQTLSATPDLQARSGLFCHAFLAANDCRVRQPRPARRRGGLPPLPSKVFEVLLGGPVHFDAPAIHVLAVCRPDTFWQQGTCTLQSSFSCEYEHQIRHSGRGEEGMEIGRGVN